MSFNDKTLTYLKNIASKLSEYHPIENIHKMRKHELVSALNDHFEVKNGNIHLKNGFGAGASHNLRIYDILRSQIATLKQSCEHIFNIAQLKGQGNMALTANNIHEQLDTIDDHLIAYFGNLDHSQLRNFQNRIDNLHARLNILTEQLQEHGGSAASGYVRRLEAEKKITNESFKKIKKPSQWLINKYGNMQEIPPEIAQETHPIDAYPNEEAPQNNASAPIFADNENLDFNVGKSKQKKKKTAKKSPTEAEEERQQEAHRKELERKQQLLQQLQHLKKRTLECKKLIQQELNKYYAVLESLKHEKLKKDQKYEREQLVYKKHQVNVQKIKEKYPDVYKFSREHACYDDTNRIYKEINNEIRKL